MMDSYDSYQRRRSDDEFYRNMLDRNSGGMVRESASSEACLHYLDCLTNPETSETGDSPQTDYSTDDPAWRDAEYQLIIEKNNARSVIEESDLPAPLKDTLRAFVDSRTIAGAGKPDPAQALLTCRFQIQSVLAFSGL
jgi:hypothetical protein